MSDHEGGPKGGPKGKNGWTDRELVYHPPFCPRPAACSQIQLVYLFALVEHSGVKFDYHVRRSRLFTALVNRNRTPHALPVAPSAHAPSASINSRTRSRTIWSYSNQARLSMKPRPRRSHHASVRPRLTLMGAASRAPRSPAVVPRRTRARPL
jgi:hypothetical protein